jgi:hypothetical protein
MVLLCIWFCTSLYLFLILKLQLLYSCRTACNYAEMVNTLSRLAIDTDGQKTEDGSANANQQHQQQRHAKADAPASASSTAAGGGQELEVHREQCVSLGKFLAGRLVEIGVTHAFAVPGDFNLSL